MRAKRAPKSNAAMPTYDELRSAAAKVGRALARSRGLDPDDWFKGLPAHLSVLPYDLLRLFAEDEELWTSVASHQGQSLDQYKAEAVDLFEPTLGVQTLYVFRCSGCGAMDETVRQKTGVQHWRRGREAEPFEVACGAWQPVRPGAGR